MISEQAAEIFLKARTLDPGTRAEFVQQKCGDSKELRSAVESLLAASNDSEAYFKNLAGKVSLDSLVPDDDVLPVNKVIGSWKLLKRIGRGGMGAVYLAERADDQFEQQAALKILPTGLDTDQARARFLVERQILARLVHDNIARLLDGGVTDDGVPYFVMDYVEGPPIDEYCREHDLSVRKRLQLVLGIARAVQFAHRNLIVHRDLKPNNVLVDDAGEVRLLDFGVAKMLLSSSPDSQLTQHSRRPATPAFSSPEMLRGEPVDATTDVYSIGALIYVLLVGKAPLKYENLSLTEMYEHASVVTPELMSRTDPTLKGELDAIVAKALAKLPEERYESVESLANDIQNYLDGLPVSAKPLSTLYRARKFVGRHRVGTAFFAFAIIALASIAALASWSAITSERQAQQIEVERDRAEQTKEFLISIFESADPNVVAEEQTAKELLEAGRARIEKELSEQPATQADLLESMSSVYRSWRLAEDDREVLLQALELRAQANGTSSKEYATVLAELAVTADIGGDYDASLDYAQQALEISTTLNDAMGQARGNERVGRVLHLQGKFDAADTHYRKALELIIGEKGEDSIEASYMLEHLGNLYVHQQKNERALVQLQAALDTRQQQYSGDHSEFSPLYLAMGSALNGLNRLDEAYAAYQSGYAMNDRLYGPDNSYNMFFANGLGNVAREQGELDIAAARYEEAARLIIQHTPNSPNLAFAHANSAKVHARRKRCDLALQYFENAASIFTEKLPGHRVLGDVRWRWGQCLAILGNYEAAEPLILSGIDIVEAQWGQDHEISVDAREAAVELYEAWGKPEAAQPYTKQ